MQGKIMKGIAGFYYVYVVGSGLYECRAKGIFRKDKIKPLVGDNVEIEILDNEAMEGNLVDILERKNTLIRPAVANIDQALVIFAAAKPDPNFNLLDRFLVRMEMQEIPTVICINKDDYITEKEQQEIREMYEPAGYPVYFTSAKLAAENQADEGLQALRVALSGKTTTVAGPSGVGKSSLINLLQNEVEMQTGAISEKIDRGKHTTRHAELIYIDKETFIMDTPGFTSLYIDEIEKEELQGYFPEFIPYEPYCKFQGCSHIVEPTCGIKDALSEGKIHPQRYENYKQMYLELKNKKPTYR